jgi:hypothetical protein
LKTDWSDLFAPLVVLITAAPRGVTPSYQGMVG